MPEPLPPQGPPPLVGLPPTPSDAAGGEGGRRGGGRGGGAGPPSRPAAADSSLLSPPSTTVLSSPSLLSETSSTSNSGNTTPTPAGGTGPSWSGSHSPSLGPSFSPGPPPSPTPSASTTGTTSSKAVLTIALQKAQSAVLLDTANNVPAAISAYKQAVRLLEEVMDRVTAKEGAEAEADGEDERQGKRRKGRRSKQAREEERRRLKVIHDTYADRIRLLSMIYSPDGDDSDGSGSDVPDVPEGVTPEASPQPDLGPPSFVGPSPDLGEVAPSQPVQPSDAGAARTSDPPATSTMPGRRESGSNEGAKADPADPIRPSQRHGSPALTWASSTTGLRSPPKLGRFSRRPGTASSVASEFEEPGTVTVYSSTSISHLAGLSSPSRSSPSPSRPAISAPSTRAPSRGTFASSSSISEETSSLSGFQPSNSFSSSLGAQEGGTEPDTHVRAPTSFRDRPPAPAISVLPDSPLDAVASPSRTGDNSAQVRQTPGSTLQAIPSSSASIRSTATAHFSGTASVDSMGSGGGVLPPIRPVSDLLGVDEELKTPATPYFDVDPNLGGSYDVEDTVETLSASSYALNGRGAGSRRSFSGSRLKQREEMGRTSMSSTDDWEEDPRTAREPGDDWGADIAATTVGANFYVVSTPGAGGSGERDQQRPSQHGERQWRGGGQMLPQGFQISDSEPVSPRTIQPPPPLASMGAPAAGDGSGSVVDERSALRARANSTSTVLPSGHPGSSSGSRRIPFGGDGKLLISPTTGLGTISMRRKNSPNTPSSEFSPSAPDATPMQSSRSLPTSTADPPPSASTRPGMSSSLSSEGQQSPQQLMSQQKAPNASGGAGGHGLGLGMGMGGRTRSASQPGKRPSLTNLNIASATFMPKAAAPPLPQLSTRKASMPGGKAPPPQLQGAPGIHAQNTGSIASRAPPAPEQTSPLVPSSPTQSAHSDRDRGRAPTPSGVAAASQFVASSLPPPDLSISLAPPASSIQRPFHLMRTLHTTITSGGYLTRKLFIPRALWSQSGARLAAVETKVRMLELIAAALEGVDRLGDDLLHGAPPGAGPPSQQGPASNGSAMEGSKTVDKFIKELDGFDGLIDMIQNTLAKKLNFLESVSGKKSNQSSFGAWSSKLSRSLDRMTNGPKNDAPMTYVEGLAKVFSQAQVLDRHISHLLQATASPVDTSSSYYPVLSPAMRALIETRLIRASDFFGNVICAFVVRDLGVLIDKYVKRGGGWVVE